MNADWPGQHSAAGKLHRALRDLHARRRIKCPYAELKKLYERSAASASPSFEQAERQAIIDALRAVSGRIAGKGGAAERLGLKRTTLQNKMHKLNISRAEYSG